MMIERVLPALTRKTRMGICYYSGCPNLDQEKPLRPSQVLRSRRAAVLQIAAHLGAQNVRVFGSVLHGKDTEDSDVDLLVDVPRGTTLLDMVRLQNAIEKELGISVDVLTALDLPAKFREQVVREARPL